MIVGRFKASGNKDGVDYLPYESFLKELWAGNLV